MPGSVNGRSASAHRAEISETEAVSPVVPKHAALKDGVEGGANLAPPPPDAIYTNLAGLAGLFGVTVGVCGTFARIPPSLPAVLVTLSRSA